MPEAHNRRFTIIVAFALVYFFWGSTYLGIRVAVERVPPILMAGVRFFTAGLLMLAWRRAAGHAIRVTRDELWRLAVVGVLLLSVSNSVLAWAELYVPTGLAALIISVVPIWFLLVERWVAPARARVRPRSLLGIVMGACGVAVLLWPKIEGIDRLGWMQLAASTSLIGSSFIWALGSVLSREWRLGVDALVASGWQMLVAGAVNCTLGLSLGQHRAARFDGPAVAAILYLVVFGSWVGYSAYLYLLRHVRSSKVSTYAYINPIVAMALGWLALGERVDVHMALGTAIIIPAVALVTLEAGSVSE